ncbi:enoyl-CoA hydratase/isomerase family protein [Coralloluteibacterium stylophorae]|uniref:Enoyl-CoA hydratase/isomerase family protein n=1 Tax=Coralloluteibacterium stylophorae TaxID=1776034 RepID=A0A8J7VVU7_9GAMM|nr:enoyl-CoA hydratase/isomerase family protein [Coralloluteibacterium stylophorae]MBS7458910.1 enoyl-CoA hydratase/isomerase family protein [Coralloluteibacterium stylophorae]
MIDVSTHDGIHTLRLARPPANALDPALLRALIDAVEAAPRDGARGIVLAGGRGIFSAGLDVPHLLTLDRAGMHGAWSAFFGAARALARCPVPVVAAIGGHCPAGGCVLALCCDYRVMALADAGASPYRIGLNEVQVGVPVPDAVQHLMRRTVGPRQAEKLLVIGAMPDTGAALALGLVDEAVPMDEVEPRAQAWLQALSALPQHAVRATREVARADLVATMTDPVGTAVEPFVDVWFAEPTQAALQAMVARLRR